MKFYCMVTAKAAIVQSVNGPGVTIIRGFQVPGTTNGDNAVRCVYLTNGAVLSGFTLTNGATRTACDYSQELSGGGVLAKSACATITNCSLSGNAAHFGGGAYSGTLNNCTLSGNSAYCGGGACLTRLTSCILRGNRAGTCGGGAFFGTLDNCMLTGNSAYDFSGGADHASLNNCTLSGNSASNSGGGVSDSTLTNCIVYYNTAPNAPNYSGGLLDHCCTMPMPSDGNGNITNLPLFSS